MKFGDKFEGDGIGSNDNGSLLTNPKYKVGLKVTNDNLNKPPCRTSSDPNGIANGVKGQPILERLKTYSEKLPLYVSYLLKYGVMELILKYPLIQIKNILQN